MKPIKYIAFLRGINVGGNKKVSMAELVKTMEKNGFAEVKTLLASGNVIFIAEEKNIEYLTEKVQLALKERFGFEISVILRTWAEIKNIINSDPFYAIATTAQTRLYVTFLLSPPRKTDSKLKIPYETPEKDFKILSVLGREVYSVLTVSEKRNSTDLMGIIEKEFGKNVTTRNWNTVLKVAAI